MFIHVSFWTKSSGDFSLTIRCSVLSITSLHHLLLDRNKIVREAIVLQRLTTRQRTPLSPVIKNIYRDNDTCVIMVNQMGTNLTSTTLASTHTSFFLPTSSWSLSSTYISETFCLFDFGIDFASTIDVGIDTHKLFSPHLGFESFLLLRIFGRGRAATDWFNPFTWSQKKTLLSNKYSSRPSPEVLSLFVPYFLCTSKKGVWLLAFAPEPAFLAQGVDAQTWFAGSSWWGWGINIILKRKI